MHERTTDGWSERRDPVITVIAVLAALAAVVLAGVGIALFIR